MLDRHTCTETPFILQRLHLIWGHSDLLLCAKMLIYITEDLAVEAQPMLPWLPCVSQLSPRGAITLYRIFKPDSPPQETHGAGSADTRHLRRGAACKLQALTYSNPASTREKLGHAAPLPEGARALLPQSAALAVV